MKKLYGLGILLLMLNSCDSPFVNEQNTLSASISGNELVVKNGLDYDIYFFACNQNTLAVISWVPQVTDENKVKSGEAKSFNLDVVLGYQPEETVIFHYWDAQISEVRFFEID